MNGTIEAGLEKLRDEGNLRTLKPGNMPPDVVDLSSNDYLGISSDRSLHDEFLGSSAASLPFSASASRLLAGCREPFASLERTISDAYGMGREALLFNSGYHANTGLIPPLCDSRTIIVADRLVHASIIDGIRLSGARFTRFRHNDMDHLRRILEEVSKSIMKALIIVESVYSMDGDTAPLDEIAALKRALAPDGCLYVDEAHAVGVEGEAGLGLARSVGGVDIIVGTFGKALASAGAYAVMNGPLRQWMINKSRSLIFSTALPPFLVAWSEFTFLAALGMDTRRRNLHSLGWRLNDILHRHGAPDSGSGHIRPLIVGDPRKAVTLSERLLEHGFNVLPIRRPTVPPGTDRLRFSLSATLDPRELHRLDDALALTISSLSE